MKKKISALLACMLLVSLCLSLAVAANPDPTADIPLPGALIQGFTYSLQYPGATMTVNGEACGSTFLAEGEEMTLSYTDSKGNALGTYTLPVIDTQGGEDRCAYFYDAENQISVSENRDSIALSFANDSDIAFINKLSADQFSLYISRPDSTFHFGSMKVTLTDAVKSSVSLSFTVDFERNTLSQGGNSANLGDKKDTLQFNYKNLSQMLLIGSTELLTCSKDDNGKAFSGFSGGVYLTVSFSGVTDQSTVAVSRINNQALGHKDGSPINAEPVVVITSEFLNQQKIGETFRFPTVEAYDVLHEVTKVTVKVEDPKGKVYSEPFAIREYGRHKVVYSAEDSAGVRFSGNKAVFVNDDVAPTLKVNALSATEYTLGGTVKIPTYTVSDNLGSTHVDMILILPNQEIRLLTHDENGNVNYALNNPQLYSDTFRNDNSSFKLEQKGEYIIRVVAYDDQYNRAVQELKFTVK